MIKFVSANYNKKTGVSMVRIRTPLGDFVGSAKLHKDDKAYESELFGCTFAEMRATAHYYKAKAKILKEKRQAIMEAHNRLAEMSTTSYDSAEMRALRKMIYIINDEYNNLKLEADRLETDIIDIWNTHKKIIDIVNEYAKN